MSGVAAPCYHREVALQPKHALLAGSHTIADRSELFALVEENERPLYVFLSFIR